MEREISRELLGRIEPRETSVTKHTKRQTEALYKSIDRFGLLQPLVVRELRENTDLEVIDGNKRLEALRYFAFTHVDVVILEPMDEDVATEIHLALNLNGGKPAADRLADALESVIESGTDDAEKARKEVDLLKTVPLASRGIDKTVEKLRSRGRAKKSEHDPSTRSWVDFRFSVDPDAARVCDDALTKVEADTGCKRGVAFERICADFLAGYQP
jgi:ParB-like chromosome segregation protein Spo0J